MGRLEGAGHSFRERFARKLGFARRLACGVVVATPWRVEADASRVPTHVRRRRITQHALGERVITMMSSTVTLRAQRGAAAPKLVIILLLVSGIAAAAWFFTQRSGTEGVTPATPAPAAPGTAAAPAEVVTIAPEVEVLSVGQLFAAARTALAEQRMVMPAGNNALEYYLAILEKEPGNAGASEALRELFPFASGTAEQEISSGNIDEASRIIAQLAKADPENYTLTILRSKLEVRRTQLDRELATQAAATAAAAARAATPATTAPTPAATTPEPDPSPAPVAATAASTAAPAPPPVATPPPAEAAPQPRPVAAQPSPSAGNSDVGIVASASLTYPQQAARNRVEGWVEVEFTVTAAGEVQGARVLRSDPPRVFDREAVRSIERSTFRAKVENGTPVDSSLRRRIEFKLDG